MSELLIIYHSRTNGTLQMAQAAFDAATDEYPVRLVRAEACTVEDMLSARAYIFACPENLAAISGEMKEFFDRCYYPVLGKIEGQPYAQMICAGSDGENAVRQIARIAKGWRLKAVQSPLIICTHAQTQEEILADKVIADEDLSKCRETGAAMAAGLAMGVF